jgi:ornithine cyclodeaminase/alanine dehydrogenase-like protein (mu-crystallin family)
MLDKPLWRFDAFIKNTPLDQILRMKEMIEVIEDALKELRLGRGFDLPRRRIHHRNRTIFGLLPGSMHGFMGAYLQTDLDRCLHNETVILYSVESGEPLILFQNCSINEARTG